MILILPEMVNCPSWVLSQTAFPCMESIYIGPLFFFFHFQFNCGRNYNLFPYLNLPTREKYWTCHRISRQTLYGLVVLFSKSKDWDTLRVSKKNKSFMLIHCLSIFLYMLPIDECAQRRSENLYLSWSGNLNTWARCSWLFKGTGLYIMNALFFCNLMSIS